MKTVDIFGLAHVGLYVNDADKSVQFYQDILGFELIHEAVNKVPEGDVLVKFVQNRNLVMEIVQFPYEMKREDGWFDHISLAVKNIEHVMEILQEKGICFEEGSYTVAPNVFPPGGSKWVFFRGPDGENIELNERM